MLSSRLVLRTLSKSVTKGAHLPTRCFSVVNSKYVVDNPYTAEPAFEGCYIDNITANNKIEAAGEVFESWSSSDINTRKQLCSAVLEQFDKRKEEIAKAITMQMGKPIAQARGEVGTMIARGEGLINMAESALEPILVTDSDTDMKKITLEPIGPSLVLSPWNYPLLCSINSIFSAVLTGNSVLVKHSNRTPQCADFFEETFRDAGAPTNLVQALHLDHDGVSEAIAHPIISYVSFTGSVGGGHSVYESVSKRFIDVGLELGGKDACYVAQSANIDRAVAGAVDGAFYNAGQSCCSVERVYVHESHYEDFVQRALRLILEYRLGDPCRESTTLGPLAQPQSIPFIQAQVDDAVAKGAQVITGGRPEISTRGRFYSPTLLVNCNHEMDVMKEETFGPVMAVQRVSSSEEALNLMNDSQYGLTASIYTEDRQEAEFMAPKLDVGTVFMNRCDFLDPYLAWSGRKDTGKGVGLSIKGFEPFLRTKSYNFNLAPPS